MRTRDKKEKIQSITMIAILVALITIAGFTFFIIGSKERGEIIETTVADHNVYLYKQDGSLSLYNTKNKQYIENHNISNETTLDKNESYINLFDISKDDKHVYASSPFSKELVVFSQQEQGLKELKRIKVNNIIDNFKVMKDSAFIQYLNNPKVDVFDLNSGKLLNTITFSDNVTSIEVDNTNLYSGVGDYIEITPLDNLRTEHSQRIHVGASTISMMKSTDGFLYASNIFATETGNSVLVKIDVNKKNVDNILAVGKEYPITMFEREDYLYILCHGASDTTLDGLSIIDKNNFQKHKNITTGHNPNSMAYTDDGYLYISHEDGKVSIINAKNDFTVESSITVNGVKNVVIK